jgi:hypothetical protein
MPFDVEDVGAIKFPSAYSVPSTAENHGDNVSTLATSALRVTEEASVFM